MVLFEVPGSKNYLFPLTILICLSKIIRELKFTRLMYLGPWRSTTKGFLNTAFEVPGRINYIFSLTILNFYLKVLGSWNMVCTSILRPTVVLRRDFPLNVAFEVPGHTLYLFSLINLNI